MIDRTVLIDAGRTFTRSDGTLVARIYERLTKRSRRRQSNHICEANYRRGVYDAFKTMQEELDELL